jgi:hypothetical protein
MGAAGRGNPLSLRLYKILGARYEDDGTREALEILSGMYAPAGEPAMGAGTGVGAAGKSVATAAALARRNADADAESDESEEGTVVSPRTTGFVVKPTTPATAGGVGSNDSAARARKHLKRDVEMKMARSSRSFLSAFREVDEVCLTIRLALVWTTDEL